MMKKPDPQVEKMKAEHLDGFEDPSNTLVKAMSFTLGTGLPLPTLNNIDVNEVMFPTPADIATMETENVTEMMAEWTHLMNFANVEVAKANIESRAKQNKYDKVLKETVRTFRDGGLSKEEARTQADVQTVVQTALFNLELAKAKKEMIETLAKTYTQNYKMLSRELSRRGIIVQADWGATRSN